MNKKPVVYIAGPECFMPDGKEKAEAAVKLCEELGFDPISPAKGHPMAEPVDFSKGKKEAGKQIFRNNIRYINSCDLVIANMNDFRGWEPDGGTCFEIGYAYTQGKKIYVFIDNVRPYYEKYKGDMYYDGVFWRDGNGAFFESGCMNLMISGHATVVEGTFEDAVRKAKEDFGI